MIRFFLLFLVAAQLNAATSATRHGITWTFDGDYTVGAYWNGDPYVVAPSGLQITAISPSDALPDDARDIHGSVKNPLPDMSSPYHQGFDTSLGEGSIYLRTMNVARTLPLSLVPGDALISTQSFASLTGENGARVEAGAVLMVVAVAPPANSFRPPFHGTHRPSFGVVDDLDLSFLPNLAPVAAATDLTTYVADKFNGIAFEIFGQWPNSGTKFKNNGPNYGRDINVEVSTAALLLCLNTSTEEQKRAALAKIVQRGIDIYGFFQAGGRLSPNGGHHAGRKLPLLIAGRALSAPDITYHGRADIVGRNRFQEDGQVDYVQLSDVETPRSNLDKLPYTQGMIGMADWWSNGISERNAGTANIDDNSYRLINGRVYIGTALAASLLGLEATWGNPAFFDYIRTRWWPIRANADSSLFYQMWVTYGPTEFPPAPVAPEPPTDVTATAISTSQIRLQWTNPPAGTYDVLIIEQGTTASNPVPVRYITTDLTTTEAILDRNYTNYSAFTPTSAFTAGMTRHFRMKASFLGRIGSRSPSVSATTLGSTPTTPTPPSGLTVTGTTTSTVALAWTDNSDNELNFVLERSDDGSSGWTEIASPTLTMYTDTGRASATTYYYRVAAENGAGMSVPSGTVGATTDNDVPPAPPVPAAGRNKNRARLLLTQ